MGGGHYQQSLDTFYKEVSAVVHSVRLTVFSSQNAWCSFSLAKHDSLPALLGENQLQWFSLLVHQAVKDGENGTFWSSDIGTWG